MQTGASTPLHPRRGPNGIWTLQRAGQPLPKPKVSRAGGAGELAVGHSCTRCVHACRSPLLSLLPLPLQSCHCLQVSFTHAKPSLTHQARTCSRLAAAVKRSLLLCGSV